MGEHSYFQRKFLHHNSNKSKKLKGGGGSPAASQHSIDGSASLECNGQTQELPQRHEFPAEFSSTVADCESPESTAVETRPQFASTANSSQQIRQQDAIQEQEQEQKGQLCPERQLQTAASFDGNTPETRPNGSPFAGGPDGLSCDSSRKQNNSNDPINNEATLISASPSSRSNAYDRAIENGGAESDDHIETIAFHPEPAASLDRHSQQATTSNHHKTSGGKESRLRKATKAILSLRRATSSLAGSSHHGDNSGNHNHHRSGFSYPRSLVATFWRQNTADNSTCTRSARLDSFNSYHNSWLQSAAHLNGGGGSQLDIVAGQQQMAPGRQGRAPDLDQQSTASSSAFRLPQFIVPKMNALKLPIVCLIKSLDGELMREIFVHRYELGQYLIDNLKVSLGMEDAKYFGLKLAKSLDEQEDVGQPWLDLNESVYKQISKHCKTTSSSLNLNQQQQQAPENAAAVQVDLGKGASTTTAPGVTFVGNTKSVDFYLRIKFYPPNLARIRDPFLKQYLWLQLRRDLRLGKLTSSMNNLTLLMAYTLQYELGDFKKEHVSEQLASLNVLPNQDLIEQQAIGIWRDRLTGTKRHQVQMQFLRASVILETYGFDYYPVRDHQRQRAYLLGFNYAGIKTVRNGRIVHHFRWHNLSKISYERRMIIFHIYPSENSKRKQILGFKCLSNEDCTNLYMRLQEQKYFFTVDLTYFDKSLRRPSHLTESSLNQQEQQQLAADLPATAGGGGGGASQEFHQYDDDLDEFGDLCETSPRDQPLRSQQEQEQPRVQKATGQEEQHETAVSSNSIPQHDDRPLPSASGSPPAFNGCDCVSCKRDLRMFRQHQHFNNQSLESSGSSSQQASLATATTSRNQQPIKSNSFQESTPISLSPRHRNARNFCDYSTAANDSNSPESFINRSSCCTGIDHLATPESTANYHQPQRDGDHERGQLFRRQCSVLNYSPDFEMINETVREQNHQNGSPSANQMPLAHGDDLGHRMASLAEQVLTQPARIFTCCQDSWSTAQAQQQQFPINNQQQASPMHQPFDGSLFMQGLLFCMLILILDLALRLSDGLSSALQKWLTFNHDSSGVNYHHACQVTPPSALVGNSGA